MAGYTLVEAALLAVVQSYNSGATFTTANSTRNDWRVLDAPGDVCAVIECAGDSLEGDDLDDRGSMGKRQEAHQPCVWVCVKRKSGIGGDGASIATLTTLVDALKAHIRQYERLNGATDVTRAQITTTSSPADLIPRRDGPSAWVAQRITLRVNVEYAPTILEYAQ